MDAQDDLHFAHHIKLLALSVNHICVSELVSSLCSQLLATNIESIPFLFLSAGSLHYIVYFSTIKTLKLHCLYTNFR